MIKMKKKLMNKKKTKLTIYIVLRVIVVATMIRQIFLQDWHNVFMCILTLILFLIPSMIKKKLIRKLMIKLEILGLLMVEKRQLYKS